MKYSGYLLLLFFISANSYSQVIDTIFFDKKWDLTNYKNCHYYRIVETNDTIAIINDYNKNGHIQWIGYSELNGQSLDTSNIKYLSGLCTWYDKKGRIEKTYIYKPFENTNQLSRHFKDTINKNKNLNPELVFMLFYYKNGIVHSNGFAIPDCDCDKHFKWRHYSRKGIINASCEFENGVANGECCWYYKGNISRKWYVKNGKKHGEFTSYNPSSGIVIKHGNYKDGKKHGEFKYYNYSEGDLKKMKYFKEGEKLKRK